MMTMTMKSNSILLLFCVAILATILTCSSSSPCHRISQKDRELIQTMLPPDNGQQFLEIYEENYDILAGLDINSIFAIINGNKPTLETCEACDSVLKLGQALPDNEQSLEFLKSFACKDFNETTPSITGRECIGLIDRLGPAILYILHNTKVPLDEGCSVLIGYECSKFLNRSYSEWTFWELPMPRQRQQQQQQFKLAQIDDNGGEKNRKILHLTDIHLDLFYTKGSNSKCNEPLCCRSTSYVVNNKSYPAGYWGEMNGDCDIPLELVSDSIRQIREQHPDIDMIFWTGDNVPHDVWNTSKTMVIEHNKIVANLIKETFAGVPVLPALGNHEAHPINMYVPIEVSEKNDNNHSMDWLYNIMADEIWSEWLTEENRMTFKKGGYYSRMINNDWKVIVLNSNAGYRANFWRAYNPIDPDNQLRWLMQELDHAERTGAFVSILGHIPPSDMYEGWLHNYIMIFDRYSHIITGAYNGHTHNDELAVMYNMQGRPIAINYISGSLTTFSFLNPSYKIFEMNPQGKPLNFDVFFMDLDHENRIVAHNNHSKPKDYQPKWLHEFDAIDSYQMKNLSPEEWAKWVDNAITDLDMAYIYSQHYHRHSRLFPDVKDLTLDHIIELVKSIKTISPFSKLQFN
ncbi:Sphingomyelin phosphodiesterase [Dermatophagoides farinae]|uniref:Sphingomyelin phosphodiesterase n=1 Tax=Dermatophagoides farinae TaxID=6954 RepID=A0A922HYI2_DERFA|nr:Sphingomyelin phosphodiesterase [Dermatophagoides farinae]